MCRHTVILLRKKEQKESVDVIVELPDPVPRDLFFRDENGRYIDYVGQFKRQLCRSIVQACKPFLCESCNGIHALNVALFFHEGIVVGCTIDVVGVGYSLFVFYKFNSRNVDVMQSTKIDIFLYQGMIFIDIPSK